MCYWVETQLESKYNFTLNHVFKGRNFIIIRKNTLSIRLSVNIDKEKLRFITLSWNFNDNYCTLLYVYVILFICFKHSYFQEHLFADELKYCNLLISIDKFQKISIN